MPLFGYWYERFPLVSSINDDTNVWGGVVGQDLKSFTDALSSWFGFGVKRAIFLGSHTWDLACEFFFFFFGSVLSCLVYIVVKEMYGGQTASHMVPPTRIYMRVSQS